MEQLKSYEPSSKTNLSVVEKQHNTPRLVSFFRVTWTFLATLFFYVSEGKILCPKIKSGMRRVSEATAIVTVICKMIVDPIFGSSICNSKATLFVEK